MNVRDAAFSGADHPAITHENLTSTNPASGIGATFADFEKDAHSWITLATGEFYPDILVDACLLYEPVLQWFGRILRSSESSSRLLREIAEVRQSWMRIQLCRVFKRYVSPSTPVEMLKSKSNVEQIIDRFGPDFRHVAEVQKAFSNRPMPDEPLCVLLWEYKDRGKKGYDLTERFFELFRTRFPELPIIGPERAGKDVLLRDVFDYYPNPMRPIDFVIYSEDREKVLAIGLARYDGDRGGAQEDDRTGGYRDAAREILDFAESQAQPTKVIFLNDGPRLLLGSMWRDYARIEENWAGRVMVTTLRMIPERVTMEWLRS